MKYVVFGCVGILFFTIISCSTGSTTNREQTKSDTTDIVHYNIIVAPDLSNRLDKTLYPRPVSDDQITEIILKNFFPNITGDRGRSENQNDQIHVGFINKKAISELNLSTSTMQIDLSQFKNQLNRIDYIKGRSNSSFSKDTTLFMDEFRKMTSLSKEQIHGADIWSYLNSGIDRINILEHGGHITYNKKVYRNKYKNILILLTDGYIEAGIYKQGGCPDNPKECYYLSKSRIAEIRQEFKKSESNNIQQFLNDSNYKIIPANNAVLSNVDILVLELYDRSLSKNGTPTVYPTDMDIMKELWSKWLKESRVRKFEIKPIFSSPQEAERAVMDFILSEE